MALLMIILIPMVGVLCQLAKEAGSCSPENIPIFGDTSRDELVGPVQALVPAYTFTCDGMITMWGACVQPGSILERYDIDFQVFRPSSVGGGCYNLVGSNFLDDGQPGVTGGNIDHCVALTDIPPEDQIQVQPGDVVGFHATNHRNGDVVDGGVQLDLNITTVTVWSAADVTNINPDVCQYRIGENLDSSSTYAPVITAQVVAITSLVTPTPSPFSSLSTRSSQPPSPPTNLATSSIPMPPCSPVHPPPTSRPHLATAFTYTNTPIQPSWSTQTQPQPLVPSSTKPLVPDSTNNGSSSHNLIIYGAIGGVVGLVLIAVIVVVIVVFRKKRGVVKHSTKDNLQTKENEAYSINLTSFAITTTQNEAYGAVQSVDTDVVNTVNQLSYEECSLVETRKDRNNTPVFSPAQNGEVQPVDTDEGYIINEAYGEVQPMDTNEGYIINEAYGEVQPVGTDEGYIINEAYGEVQPAINEVYGAVVSGLEDVEYDYITQ